MRISPEVVISMGTRVKQAGEEMRGEPVELIAWHEPRSGELPYERLLGDAIRGDASLFTSDEAVEAARAVVDPVLGSGESVRHYEHGSWGPAKAAGIVRDNVGWHDPKPEESEPC